MQPRKRLATNRANVPGLTVPAVSSLGPPDRADAAIMMRDVAKLSRFLVAKSKQDPQVLFIHSQTAAISIIIAAIEAVMMVVMVMMVVVAPIARDHHDRRVIVIAIATIEAVMVMVVVMMMIVKLSELNIFA